MHVEEKQFSVVLVEPKTPGNVGAVARVMANFGLSHLVLINPCEINDEARIRATHGIGVLENATVSDSLEKVVKGRFVVGTTGHPARKQKVYHRMNWSSKDIKEKLARTDMPVALLFGREDDGLFNEELALCDAGVTIPANPDYPILNLSHAVAVVLYELFSRKLDLKDFQKATEDDKERMVAHFSELLDAINYEEHRKERTRVMFKRMIGRSAPTNWEYHTLLGIIKKAAQMAREKE